jgi:site-specific DNA-methyltransferase (adenine-specific)
MTKEANAAGRYEHKLMSRNYDRIRIVTIEDMIENGERLEIPMSLEVLKAAQKAADTGQIDLI